MTAFTAILAIRLERNTCLQTVTLDQFRIFAHAFFIVANHARATDMTAFTAVVLVRFDIDTNTITIGFVAFIRLFMTVLTNTLTADLPYTTDIVTGSTMEAIILQANHHAIAINRFTCIGRCPGFRLFFRILRGTSENTKTHK